MITPLILICEYKIINQSKLTESKTYFEDYLILLRHPYCSLYLLEELGVEKMSMAGAVIIPPAEVDTGEAAVVKEVCGFLASSFRRCSC